MITRLKGEIEIDHKRGVIYFHSVDKGTILRICNLPKPIPQDEMLDITHMINTTWHSNKLPSLPSPPQNVLYKESSDKPIKKHD